MTTGTQYYEGTNGAYPTPQTAFYGSAALISQPTETNATVALSNTRSISGSTSAKVLHTATNVSDSQAGSIGESFGIWSVRYYYFTAAPTVSVSLSMRTNVAWTEWQDFGLTPAGALFLNAYHGVGSVSDNYGSGGSTADGSIAWGEWFRVESYRQSTHPSVYRIWKQSGQGHIPNGRPPDYQLTAYAPSPAGTVGGMWDGIWSYGSGSFSPRTFLSSGEAVYMDEAQVTDSGWFNPPVNGKAFAGIVPI